MSFLCHLSKNKILLLFLIFSEWLIAHRLILLWYAFICAPCFFCHFFYCMYVIFIGLFSMCETCFVCLLLALSMTIHEPIIVSYDWNVQWVSVKSVCVRIRKKKNTNNRKILLTRTRTDTFLMILCYLVLLNWIFHEFVTEQW